MRKADMVEGTVVRLVTEAMLDENGEPWAYGKGPFRIARVYRTPGYTKPWFRLALMTGNCTHDLPGSFRAKELKALAPDAWTYERMQAVKRVTRMTPTTTREESERR